MVGVVMTAAFRVHTALGPGLLEAVYEGAMLHELRKTGLRVASQVALPVMYDGIKLANVGYRLDLLVEDKLILELKSVEALAPIHTKQLLNYLKLSNLRLGLLINFNVVSLKDHIHRVVNKL